MDRQPKDLPPSDFSRRLGTGSRPQRLVRAAGNIRILLLGWPGRVGARNPSRPIATGTFAFPAFGSN